MPPRRARTLALLAAVSLGAAPLPAQQPAEAPLTQRASVNLLGIPFGLVSGEYERFATEEVSLGAAAGIDENSESWLEAKARYYPGARGPRGFAVGMSVGVARLRAFTDGDCFIVCADASGPFATGVTIGAVLDYQWLLGRRQRFYLGTGVGAKRVLGLRDEPRVDAPSVDYRQVLPSFRLQTGFAF